jgi:TetR/AcrR family transcriptional repressor of bet genes
MPRPTNTEERRAELADALGRVMARAGYAGATVAAIAREAGLASGLFHYHFGSKREALLTLAERLGARLEARVEVRLARALDSPRARLTAYVDAHLALGDDADPSAVATWVLIAAEAVREPDVRTVHLEATKARLARLRDLFAACLRADGRGARGAGRMAAAVLATIEGAYLLAAAAPGALPVGYAAPTLARMIDGLLADELR